MVMRMRGEEQLLENLLHASDLPLVPRSSLHEHDGRTFDRASSSQDA